MWLRGESRCSWKAGEAKAGTIAAQALQDEPAAVLPTGNVSKPSMWKPFQLEGTGAQNQRLEAQLRRACFFLAACTQQKTLTCIFTHPSTHRNVQGDHPDRASSLLLPDARVKRSQFNRTMWDTASSLWVEFQGKLHPPKKGSSQILETWLSFNQRSKIKPKNYLESKWILWSSPSSTWPKWRKSFKMQR